MPEIPRAIPSFRPQRRTFAYIRRPRWRWFQLAESAVVESEPTRYMECKKYVRVREVDCGDIPVLQAVNLLTAHKLLRVEKKLRNDLAQVLLDMDRVVTGDIRIEYSATVTARLMVETWPAEPGVTTPPYRPIANPDIELPCVSTHLDTPDLVRQLSIREADVSLHYNMVVLVHPATLRTAERILLTEYFRFHADGRVPVNVMRIAEEVR